MKHVYDAGQILPVRPPVVRAAVHWSPLTEGRGGHRGPADVHTSVLLLDARGLLAAERDAVGPERAGDDSGGVRRLPKRRHRDGVMDAVELRPGLLPAAVRRVILAVSADGAPFGASGSLQLTLWDVENDLPVTARPVTSGGEDHTTLVCGELWRDGPGWEFRAVRRGLAGGPAELAAAHRTAADATGPPPLRFGPGGGPPRPRRSAAPPPIPPLPAAPPVTPPPPAGAPFAAPGSGPGGGLAPAAPAQPSAATPPPPPVDGAAPPAAAAPPAVSSPQVVAPAPASAPLGAAGSTPPAVVELPPQGPQFRSVRDAG